MNQNVQNSYFIQFLIKMFPGNCSFSYSFDPNRSFGDLKNNLQENGVLSKDTYYFEMNGEAFSDNMILREKNVSNGSCLDAIRKDIINITVRVEGNDDKTMTVSDLATIEALKESAGKSYNMKLDKYIVKVDGNACDDNNSLKDCGVVFGSVIEFNVDHDFIRITVRDSSYEYTFQLKKTTKIKTLAEELVKRREDGRTEVIIQKDNVALDSTERTFEDYGIVDGTVLSARFSFPGGVSYLK